jgi:NACalpha-BTF3-like transcription factor
VLTALKTMGKLYFEYKEPEKENPIQDTPKSEDIEIIMKPVKVSQNKPKQPKKPITVRSKTNKK